MTFAHGSRPQPKKAVLYMPVVQGSYEIPSVDMIYTMKKESPRSAYTPPLIIIFMTVHVSYIIYSIISAT